MKLQISPAHFLKHTCITAGAILALWLIWWLAMPSARKERLQWRVTGATTIIATKLTAALGPVREAYCIEIILGDRNERFKFTVDPLANRRHLCVVLVMAMVVGLALPTEWIRKLAVYVVAYPLGVVTEGFAVARALKSVSLSPPASLEMSTWSHPYWLDALALLIFAAALWLTPWLLFGDEEE